MQNDATTDHSTGIPPGLPTWKDLKLHHWLILERKYGKPRPSKLEKKYAERSEAERRTYMERVLGLVGVREYTENDPWGRTVLVNQRVVLKTLRNPPRTPAVAWLKFAIRNAIELWEKPVEVGGGKKELRRYYLCPINKPQKYAVAVIVGEDGVVFNVIDCDSTYAQNLRSGDLLEIAYNDDRKFCLSHDCCDDIVAMETAFARAENERKVAIKVAREAKKRLGMKNPPG